MEIGMHSQGFPMIDGRKIILGIVKFFSRMSFTLVLTLIMSTGIVGVLLSSELIWKELFPAILAVWTGLTAGLLTRFLFRKIPKFIRWVMSGMVIGAVLALIGLMAGEWLQDDLTGISSALVKPDFAVVSGIGWVVAFLSIFAWQRKKNANPELNNVQTEMVPEPAVTAVAVVEPVRRPLRSRKSSSSRKRSFFILPGQLRKQLFMKRNWKQISRKSRKFFRVFFKGLEKRITRPIAVFFSTMFSTAPRAVRRSSRAMAQPVNRRPLAPVLSPTPLPRKRVGKKLGGAIRFVGREELRCPYCLQIVDRRDKRGIVVCPICKSAHHKECWDITGSCQVPHNHAVL